MQKIIIMSTDPYTDLNYNNRCRFREVLNKLITKGDKIVFTANWESKKDLLTDINIDNKNIRFYKRDELRIKLKNVSDNKNYFIVVGNRDADLQLAASNKLFYIVPTWCDSLDILPQKYGIKVKDIEHLYKLINIIENQQSWYYRADLDEKTTILSLTSANTWGSHSEEELKMIESFRAYLKEGDSTHQMTLLYHFLASISNNKEFRDIKDWGIMPSSGTELNSDMNLMKEKARELMNGRKKEPIFLRHTATWKSHKSWENKLNRKPCDRHFDTIILNPYYKGKLKNRTVCIFDDYLTYGTTFETARNILISENAKKIFFVSLGRFGKQYTMQNYEITGDVSKPGYAYKLLGTKEIYGKIDKSAITEIEKLHNIINS